MMEADYIRITGAMLCQLREAAGLSQQGMASRLLEHGITEIDHHAVGAQSSWSRLEAQAFVIMSLEVLHFIQSLHNRGIAESHH